MVLFPASWSMMNATPKQNNHLRPKGRIVYTDKAPRLIMVNGVRQEINKENGQFSSLSFDRYSVDFEGQNPYKIKRNRRSREKPVAIIKRPQR